MINRNSGPSYIHGTVNNAIFDIASNTGTQMHAWEEEQVIFDPEGQRVDCDEAEECSELLWDDVLIANAFRHSKEEHASISPERSLQDFFIEEANGLFRDEAEDVAKRKRKMLLLMGRMWGAYVGSPVERQSLKFFWLEQCIDGENPFVAETYTKILEHVAEPVRRGAEVRYGCEVVGISSAAEKMNGDKVTVRIVNGGCMDFDGVVVTTPLGWLKQHKDAFEPSLPPRLSQAIDNIGYGTLDKVYISFASAFWQERLPADTRLADGEDPEGKTPNVRAGAHPIHQPATSGDQNGYINGALWTAPSYAPETNPERWDQECLYLSALPDGYSRPALLFYLYGDCSRHIADLATSNETPAERDAKLLAFFEPYYSRLPGYVASDPACKPVAIQATAWAADKFAGYGSYCNFQIGVEHADEDIEVMRHGMPEQGIWFAGEHTAPFVALGTTTGAYVSGEQVALRIVKKRGVDRSAELASR